MDEQERERFETAFQALAILFEGQSHAVKQRLYWETMRDACRIEEWEYAAAQACKRETFHQLPLPAHLLDYVREHRSLQAHVLRQTEQEARETAQVLAEAEAVMQDVTDPVEMELLQQQVEAQQEQRAYEDWLWCQPRRVLWALAREHRPESGHWHPFRPEDLTYEQTTIPDVERARLRTQLLQLMNEDVKQGEVE